MQFGVPQFTDVEDKIIGPLTIKQFLVMVAAGGLCLLFWSLPIPKVLAILIDLPIALIGIALAFGTYNGRPALSYIFPFVSYLLSPRNMVFKRETMAADIIQSKPAPKVVVAQVEEDESRESRLKKLAYLLDQKKVQEKELLESNKQIEDARANEPAIKLNIPSLPKFPDILPDFHKITKPSPKKPVTMPTASKPKSFEINPNQHSILD